MNKTFEPFKVMEWQNKLPILKSRPVYFVSISRLRSARYRCLCWSPAVRRNHPWVINLIKRAVRLKNNSAKEPYGFNEGKNLAGPSDWVETNFEQISSLSQRSDSKLPSALNAPGQNCFKADFNCFSTRRTVHDELFSGKFPVGLFKSESESERDARKKCTGAKRAFNSVRRSLCKDKSSNLALPVTRKRLIECKCSAGLP